ncbi:MAG: TAXI family TRAP transporter solute-binding subunit, partial [Pseudomonadota bacterium]
VTGLCAAALVPLALVPGSAAAQSYSQFVREANANSVSIVSGLPGETSLDIATDLSNVLHCVDGLRIVPMAGRGDSNNIYDLLFLRGVDMAIVRADVLDFIEQSRTYINDLKDKVAYIAPLFTQEVHLVVSDQINSLDDLNGKFVNMGAPGSLGLAARAVLEQAGVTVVESKFDNKLALERVIDGTLDGMFLVGGKPVPLLQQLGDVSGLKLLPLPALRGTSVYSAAQFSYDDYPDLVRAGDRVSTLAVPSVLAVYNWPANHPRYAKNKAFTDALFERASYLRRPARHPKWQSVELTGDVPGWRRFSAAQEIVDRERARRPQTSPQAPRATTVAATVQTQSEPKRSLEQLFDEQLQEYGITPRSAAEREQLFLAFKRRVEAANQ